MKNLALKVSGIIFMLIALMHLLRLLFKLEARVGDFTIPLWFSVVGFIVPLALSIWIFSILRKQKEEA